MGVDISDPHESTTLACEVELGDWSHVLLGFFWSSGPPHEVSVFFGDFSDESPNILEGTGHEGSLSESLVCETSGFKGLLQESLCAFTVDSGGLFQ